METGIAPAAVGRALLGRHGTWRMAVTTGISMAVASMDLSSGQGSSTAEAAETVRREQSEERSIAFEMAIYMAVLVSLLAEVLTPYTARRCCQIVRHPSGQASRPGISQTRGDPEVKAS